MTTNLNVWMQENKRCSNLIKNRCKLTGNYCLPTHCPLSEDTLPQKQPPHPPISEGASEIGNNDFYISGGCIPSKQLKAIQLKNRGLCLKDIAKEMGITYQAVQNLINKANKKMGVVSNGRC